MKKVLITIAVLIFAFFGCAALVPDPPIAHNPSDACIVSRKFITQGLKAPTTAKFQDCNRSDAQHLGNGRYKVEITVDAQNSFSAMIRTTYIVEVQHQGTSNDWRFIDAIEK